MSAALFYDKDALLNDVGTAREAFSRYIHRVVEKYHPAVVANGTGACLYLAYHATYFLHMIVGVRAIMQAGTMSWPFADFTQPDDGGPTHLTYQWNGPEEGQIHAPIPSNCTPLPEVHVWTALPEHKTIIDLSTGSFPIAAQKLGFTWKGPMPPPFMWSDPKTQSRFPGTKYEARIGAIRSVVKLPEFNWSFQEKPAGCLRNPFIHLVTS